MNKFKIFLQIYHKLIFKTRYKASPSIVIFYNFCEFILKLKRMFKIKYLLFLLKINNAHDFFKFSPKVFTHVC